MQYQNKNNNKLKLRNMRTLYSEYMTTAKGDKMAVKCKKDTSRTIAYECIAQDCRGDIRVIVYEEKTK